jgi:EAL and modified HD-GYP domain-containing signal transduction protein
MTDRFIARQPIFDARLKVFAYELLFRAGPENLFTPGQSRADDVIVNSTMLLDMQQLVGNSLAFINVDAAALLREAPRLLSPSKVVLEILETVQPTAEVVDACHALAADQYVLALDDFMDEAKWQPLIPSVRFLKVDFRAADHDRRKAIAARYLPNGIQMLAEKVETEHELQEARQLGYTLFQGYFFCKPAMVSSRDIPSGRSACLSLLEACSAAELDYDEIESLFSQEPALTFRLLRFLNSPMLPFRAEIHNVRHALSLLGEREFRRWVAIVALVMMGGHKPPELVRTALTRAYFCEELARPLRLASLSSDLFLMGLLSTADALLDRPMDKVLSELSLSPEIHSALNGGGGIFDHVYQTLLSYEKADWARLSEIATKEGYPEEQIPECFLAASKRAIAVST